MVSYLLLLTYSIYSMGKYPLMVVRKGEKMDQLATNENSEVGRECEISLDK